MNGAHDRFAADRFAADVAASLAKRPRELPSKYLYDALGSALFEAICQLPWYRITRAESSLLEAHAKAIVQPLRCPIELAELGGGSGGKLATLIERAGAPIERVHFIDISPAALAMARDRVEALGAIDVRTHHGTYEQGLDAVAAERTERPLLLLFLGSNIGNFDPPAARELLARIRRALGAGDALLLGSDLVKPEPDLLLAYDDPLRVTAAFNRNLLRRINDELGGSFDLDGFAHRAVWNAAEQRVEMHLVSRRAQRIAIRHAGLEIDMDEGETIWTESSYKYQPSAIVAEGLAAGFTRAEQWIDAAARFALTRFTV